MNCRLRWGNSSIVLRHYLFKAALLFSHVLLWLSSELIWRLAWKGVGQTEHILPAIGEVLLKILLPFWWCGLILLWAIQLLNIRGENMAERIKNWLPHHLLEAAWVFIGWNLLVFAIVLMIEFIR